MFIPLCGQELADAPDWESRWTDLETSEDLTELERLQRQTDLLRELGSTLEWRQEQLWTWVEQVLQAWERSPEVEPAYQAYMGLLEQIGREAGSSREPLPDESALREYYQRALGIARTPIEEGRLLFYQAESLLRSSPQGHDARRRIEAYLQQAALSLGDNPPMDAVQFRLAELYRNWSPLRDGTVEQEESYLSRAVFHYRYIQGMSTSRETYVEAAGAALEELLQPGLEIVLENRFLPGNDIRLPLRTLNLQQVEVQVYALPWEREGIPVSHDGLHDVARELQAVPEALVFSKVFSVQPRHRFDWNQSELRLGENFVAGWYWVRVAGEGLEESELMLVTPVEMVLIPRRDRSLTLWATDVESGIPLASAAYTLLDEEGEVLARGNCDLDGLASIPVPDNRSWSELHVHDGKNPGLLRAADLETSGGVRPWVIPGPENPSSGGQVQFALLDGDLVEEGDSMTLLYPDRSVQEATLTAPGERVWIGNAPVPDGTDTTGPVYLELTEEEHVLLGNLGLREDSRVLIDFSGERFEPQTSLFLATTPVAVRIQPGSVAATGVPDYVRVRVVPVRREEIETGSDEPTQVGSPVFENILNFGTADNRTAEFEIPEAAGSAGVQVLRVEVYSLDSAELLGQSYLAVLPYRTLVRLRISEHLVDVGDTVEVDLSYLRAEDAPPRSLEGDLVIFRETWESRYIHRKRGTLLSEADYQQLPDRSLLGSAKTDYRLLEQGFIREEMERIFVSLAEQERIPIILERAGYYHIEFDGRELETRPTYPDGPLEVWVVPESQDLRAFRSERSRLISELGDEQQTLQVMVLMNREEVTVMLDVEMEDGSHATRILDPTESSLYLDESLAGDSRLSTCRVVIVGERETDILCRHFPRQDRLRWELDADRSVGFNPGANFSWNLQRVEGLNEGPTLWAIYPEEWGRSVLHLLEAQQNLARQRLHDLQTELLTLGNWLPVYHPFVERQVAERSQATDFPDPDTLLVLYPEIRLSSPAPAASLGFSLASPDPATDQVVLEGELPITAGRWSLAAFSLIPGDQLGWQAWPFSTELPIRTTLSGPSILRLGDEPVAFLNLENTTRGRERLEVEFRAEGGLVAEQAEPIVRFLGRGQRDLVPIHYQAVGAGSGRINAIAEGQNSSSEASLPVEVGREASYPVIRSFLVQPGSPAWNRQADLSAWETGQLTVSSGLGGFLESLWPVLREKLAAEPLLRALGDWARDRTLDHLGIERAGESDPAGLLLEELERHASAGGWAWTPGHEPDPWLTSLVLWSLETFSTLAENGLELYRLEARDYLEGILINDSVSLQERLFALHALASPAYNDPRIRPSRIQARSFLSFLHDRSLLSHADLAILAQVARAYRFNEEVSLLVEELEERVRNRGVPVGSGFWSRSLVYMALGELRSSEALRNQVLQGAVENLSSLGIRRSWLQAGGYLNMLAVYYWEGDFNVDGTAVLQLEEAEPVQISLRPDSPDQGRYRTQLPDQGTVSLQLNTVDARGPVFLILDGRTANRPDWPLYPEQSEQLVREFVEDTLLAGEHQQLEDVTVDSVLRVGDTMQLFLSLYIEEPEAFGEFHFFIPSGASLSADSVQHVFEASSSEAIFAPPILEVMEQQNPLRQVFRMEPLAPGRHEFILSYRMEWPGAYRFPAHRLYVPRTGQVYQLGEPWILKIEGE